MIRPPTSGEMLIQAGSAFLPTWLNGHLLLPRVTVITWYSLIECVGFDVVLDTSVDLRACLHLTNVEILTLEQKVDQALSLLNHLVDSMIEAVGTVAASSSIGPMLDSDPTDVGPGMSVMVR